MAQKPYENSVAYLEDELGRYLPIRMTRIGVAQHAKDAEEHYSKRNTVGEKRPVALHEHQRHLQELLTKENEVRAEIDARLDATRNIHGVSGIGMDKLNYGEDMDSRLVFLCLTATALGMGENIIGKLEMPFYGTVSVSDLMTILDTKTIADRLRVRRLVLELANKGLLILDFRTSYVVPEDFNTVQVSLSRKGFATILDDPDLEQEGIPNADGDGDEG